MKLFVFCVLLTMSINTEGYLDPGTGSLMLQVILGGIAVAVAIKLYWHKLTSVFGLRKKEEPIDDSACNSNKY